MHIEIIPNIGTGNPIIVEMTGLNPVVVEVIPDEPESLEVEVISSGTSEVVADAIAQHNEDPNAHGVQLDGGGSQRFVILSITTAGQTTFTLPQVPPNPSTVNLFLNGVRASYIAHFTINGVILNYVATVPLSTADRLEILY